MATLKYRDPNTGAWGYFSALAGPTGSRPRPAHSEYTMKRKGFVCA